MPERTQINIKLSPKQKQKWEDYLDNDPMINSLSRLIRESVEEKIAETDDADTSDISEESLNEILNAVRNVETSVEDISEDIQEIGTDLVNQPDFNKLKERVFERMPELSYGRDPTKAKEAGEDVEFLTAMDYAEEMGVDKFFVYRALEAVRRHYNMVTAYDIEPKKDPIRGVVYFKET